MQQTLNDQVRRFWEDETCGTTPFITGDRRPQSREWFERIEEYRYEVEPIIHATAQFTRHRGKDLLEIGVGAGTDHLQWARAGLNCTGVDLTDAAIYTTNNRLQLYGFSSRLQRIDAEALPFADGSFDVVYSWGVIHHSERPERIVAEIHRVLRPGGRFIGMVYARWSLVAWKLWVRHALLKGRPWRSFEDVIWYHMESVGTKAYTVAEMKRMFGGFEGARIQKVVTYHDRKHIPRFLQSWVPDAIGWFITIEATKP